MLRIGPSDGAIGPAAMLVREAAAITPTMPRTPRSRLMEAYETGLKEMRVFKTGVSPLFFIAILNKRVARWVNDEMRRDARIGNIIPEPY